MADTINGFEIKDYNVHDIPENAKYHTCPKCSHNRKKSSDKCAYVNWDTGLLSCQHCGEVTQMHTFVSKDKPKIYVKPKLNLPEQNKYSDKFLNYFQSRGISEKTLRTAKVRQSKEWMPQIKKETSVICFDYYLNGEIVNIKYRDARKNFKFYKDAERVFYNLDNVATAKDVYIVEGEMDCLALIEVGVTNVVSVPNGFNLKGNVNLDYLDNYLEYFDNKENIYIAVDNDEAGRKGQKELVRRLGYDKCRIIDFKQFKDANDVLISKGKESLIERLSDSKEVKLEGVFTAKDVESSLFDKYRNGQSRGTTTYFPDIDKAWTWKSGEVNLWTGYQNEGKSLALNQLALIKAYNDGEKVAVFSPENMPLDDFFSDLIEMLIGKSADPYYDNNYMTEKEFKTAYDFVKDNFFMIYPDKDFTLQTILDKTKNLIKTKGIRKLILDPYNTIEHKMNKGEREDLYISRFMSELKRFAVENDISIHLVAHQLTARVEKDGDGNYKKPDVNYIKGGGTFADKADNVLVIWRPNRKTDYKDTTVWFMSQKIKKQKLVGHPQEITNITFSVRENRYFINGFSPLRDIYDNLMGVKTETISDKELLEKQQYNFGDDDTPF